MAGKTWFLPHDFTFFPDGQLTLGMVIPSPRRPTAVLASLTDNPAITLPDVKSIIEKNRSFTNETGRSFGFGLFSKFLDTVGASVNVDRSWYQNKSFSATDHEILSYNKAFTPETLKAIVALKKVQEYVNGGRFGKRCVYIISGLRVAKQSFTVMEEEGRKKVVCFGGSMLMPASSSSAELGPNISGSGDNTKKTSYDTTPGIVFAYRLHVIRSKDAVADAELFSSRTAFFSGEGENEEMEEMEALEVNEEVLLQDLDIEPNSFHEERIDEGHTECYITFQSGIHS